MGMWVIRLQLVSLELPAICKIEFICLLMTQKGGKKKKRFRKNKKWIPYKDLTPEEREQLRRESNRKQLRRELLERKLQVNAAEQSGDYTSLTKGPTPTNEVGIHGDDSLKLGLFVWRTD